MGGVDKHAYLNENVLKCFSFYGWAGTGCASLWISLKMFDPFVFHSQNDTKLRFQSLQHYKVVLASKTV